jgi:hypothetical protein
MRKNESIQVGFVSGRLTVIGSDVRGVNNRTAHLCLCECGKEKVITASNLRHGRATSCGCRTTENSVRATRTHGESGKSAEYIAWIAMKARCYDHNTVHWNRYGGRGITVCAEWISSFETFLIDMGRKPSARHSLDRKDVNGNYCPENCAWATNAEQALHRSDNRFISAFGKTCTIKEWEAIVKIKSSTIIGRLRRGWSTEDALTGAVREWGR